MLHHRQVSGLLVAILYGAVSALASEPPPATQQPAATRSEKPVIPHIALLLPPEPGPYARAAEAVRTGFMAAAKVQGRAPLPIRIYSAADDTQQVIAAYREALGNGARAVVGPLTRTGVAAVAASDVVTVPTLALNVPDGGRRLPPAFFVLSLNVESEAVQAAQLAWRDGRRNAMTVVGGSPLMKRMAQAFTSEFARLGGNHVVEYAYPPDLAGLARLRQAAALGVTDFAFLALDAAQARSVRPYLATLALYASSQVHPGTGGLLAGFDLAGIRFLDMPWLIQPDHPAVMIYPRGGYSGATDLDRLYALGIDAFRVVIELLDGRNETSLDGVTGRLTLGRDQQIVRVLPGARFSDGKLVPFEPARP